ncbi:unnamed protein product, partial [Protopolystoma xenopodis]
MPFRQSDSSQVCPKRELRALAVWFRTSSVGTVDKTDCDNLSLEASEVGGGEDAEVVDKDDDEDDDEESEDEDDEEEEPIVSDMAGGPETVLTEKRAVLLVMAS